MKQQDYKYADVTGKIIGGAMQVHKVLGNGFQEVIYQRCLAIELDKAGLRYKREEEIPIYYNHQQVGTRRADFLVEDKVLVELKAITALEKVHEAQIINYLTAYRIEVGLLINFGEISLQFKRFVNTPKQTN